nr:zinc finger protein 34-like [Equus caballus]
MGLAPLRRPALRSRPWMSYLERDRTGGNCILLPSIQGTLQFPKPAVISQLEQGQESYVLDLHGADLREACTSSWAENLPITQVDPLVALELYRLTLIIVC